MKNELGRKITSLTIMTIMVAGGLTFAVPGMMPGAEADHNSNLYVSAENAEFENYFGGAQIVEIVVRDSSISDTTEGASGMPKVEINGDKFAMTQGSDGAWYGYTGNEAYVAAADALGDDYGLEYGTTCTSTTATTAIGQDDTSIFDDVSAVWVSQADCALAGTDDVIVVGGAQAINEMDDAGGTSGDGFGNIGAAVTTTAWPFIQTYDFSAGSVEVCYLKAGTDECTSLEYDDSAPGTSHSTDRTFYPPGAQVELEVRDMLLNLDPTAVDNWTFDIGDETDADSTYTTEYANYRDAATDDGNTAITMTTIGFDGDNGILKLTMGGSTETVLDLQDNADQVYVDNNQQVTMYETGTNTGVFTNIDDADKANIIVRTDAVRGTVATVDYNDSQQSVLVGYNTASVDFADDDIGEWNSGETMTITLTDSDRNLNNTADEDILFSESDEYIPTIHVGTPLTLTGTVGVELAGGATTTATVDSSSGIAFIGANDAGTANTLTVGSTYAQGLAINTGIDVNDFRAMAEGLDSDGDSVLDDEDTNAHATAANGTQHRGAMIMYWDVSNLFSVAPSDVDIAIQDQDGGFLTSLIDAQATSGNNNITELFTTGTGDISDADDDTIYVNFYPNGCGDKAQCATITAKSAFYIAFMSFHSDGTNNAVYRVTVEEGDPGVYEGDVEYRTINQNEADQYGDWPSRTHLGSSVTMIMTGDLSGVDAPRIQVSDKDSDGVSTPQADQTDVLTHSGTASFDSDSYKVADTVTVTITDMDLNTDDDLIEVYKVDNDGGADGTGSADRVADTDDDFVEAGAAFSYIMEITFDDTQWIDSAASGQTGGTCTADALNASGFTLVESGAGTGVFSGTFQVPSTYCDSTTSSASTTGTDMEVNYIDFYDSSSNTIEVGAGAAIYANTGSVSLDADVYPVPFDGDATSTTAEGSFLDYAATGAAVGTATGGNVTIYIQVADSDYDQSPSGEDNIAESDGVGPVTLKIFRGADYKVLATAGGDSPSDANTAAQQSAVSTDTASIKELGPMTEICADCGVFETSTTLALTDGPRVGSTPTQKNINQGDVLTVEYTDPTDATGEASYLATDSATFDLRTGVLSTDKSVYVIGSDVIISIIDPDLNLDTDSTETYNLDLINWDSDADAVDLDHASTSFDPEPNGLRETGGNTGVFQSVIEFPATVNSTTVDRGEKVDLEYTDYGPSGASYYNDDTEDIGTVIYSSNFGATIELDQKVYSWAERVFITITAPDHNMDTALVDEIGNTTSDPMTIATRDTKLSQYKLMETGIDTGIFYGEVTLDGFAHDADGNSQTGNSSGNDKTCTASSGTGPTGGMLCAQDEDGITVSYEYTEDATVIGSALIRWNIGEAEWLDSSYSAGSSGTIRISDPDMDLAADYVDNFSVDVWSDSDSGGIDLMVTETSEMSGVFEGTVFFTTTDESSGHRLRVSEGDTVTVEYEDNTLPNPYNTSDELEIAGTAIIGTIIPPLERAPAANARVVDAFGNSLSEVSVDQQVQIEADLTNGTDGDQSFAYLVQVQDGNGVTVSLAWITGSLASGQSFSPALSWIPSSAGSYEATVFVWESVDNPSALSDTVSVNIDVV